MTDLFGREDEVKVRTTKKAKAKATESAVPGAIDLYHELFRGKFGFKPRIRGGKDGKHFKELIATWGRDDVLELVRVFFTTTDPRVTRCDYSVGALYALAQGLMIDMRGGRLDATTAHILDAVSRAGRT